MSISCNLRVLVIDDNIDTADIFGWLLMTLNHTVEVRYSAKTGLEVITQFRPHIVFCDLGMPEMSGYDFARAFRAQEPTRMTTLVAVSGWNNEQTKVRTQNAGFDAYLLKPATFSAIQLLLDGHCIDAIEGLDVP